MEPQSAVYSAHFVHRDVSSTDSLSSTSTDVAQDVSSQESTGSMSGSQSTTSDSASVSHFHRLGHPTVSVGEKERSCAGLTSNGLISQSFLAPETFQNIRSAVRSSCNVPLSSIEGLALSYARGACDTRSESELVRKQARTRRQRILAKSHLFSVDTTQMEDSDLPRSQISTHFLRTPPKEQLNHVIHTLDKLSIGSLDRPFESTRGSAHSTRPLSASGRTDPDGIRRRQTRGEVSEYPDSDQRSSGTRERTSPGITESPRYPSLYSNPVDVASAMLRVKTPYLHVPLMQSAQSQSRQQRQPVRPDSGLSLPVSSASRDGVAGSHASQRYVDRRSSMSDTRVTFMETPDDRHQRYEDMSPYRHGHRSHYAGSHYMDRIHKQGEYGSKSNTATVSGEHNAPDGSLDVSLEELRVESVSDEVLLQLLVHSARPDLHKERLEKISTPLKTRQIVDVNDLGTDSDSLWSTFSAAPPDILPAILLSVEQSLRMLNKGETKSRKEPMPEVVESDEEPSDTLRAAKSPTPRFQLSTAKAVELASTWSTVFNSIYSHVILQLPRLVLEGAVEHHRKTHEQTGADAPSSLDVQCFIANNILSVLQGMLSDIDVLNLTKETIALKIQETIAKSPDPNAS